MTSLNSLRDTCWRRLLLGLGSHLALLFSSPVWAAEPVPGDACTTAGVFLQSGGPEVAGGGHLLVCHGSVWKSVLDYSATTGRVDVDIANDTGSCTAAKTGRLRYDDADDEWEYCDGSDPWKPLGTGGSSAAPDCTDNSGVTCTLDATRSSDDPQFTAANIKSGINILGVIGTLAVSSGADCDPNPLCPNVGDVCNDGNAGTTNDPLFAGFMVYQDANSADVGKCKALYVTNNNQSTNSAWRASSAADDIATDSVEDGKFIDGQIATSTTWPAFKLCKDLTHGGFGDWYLPASDELHLLYKNRAAINANAVGAFTTTYQYWSSSEIGTAVAGTQRFSDGQMSYFSNKNTTNIYTRCVRRD